MEWQPIGENTPASENCLLWCTNENTKGQIHGVVWGRIYRYEDGIVSARGQGLHGEWNFSHWMPLPTPPSA